MYRGRRLGGRRRSSSGQAPLLTAVLFLLLVPTTIIIAENATSNITGLITNVSIENATLNVTQPANVTSATTPDGNATVNTTLPSNETNMTQPEDNTTDAPLNQTNITLPETGPNLDAILNIPRRADRNEAFIISAEITNTGDTDATNVEVEWVLPGSISILEGSGSHSCNIPTRATCTSQLLVAAPLYSRLGEHEIKVLVRYHD
jgi:hypothetical protein